MSNKNPVVEDSKADTLETEAVPQKNIVAIVMDAMNIPENETIMLINDPVAEGEVVVGTASATVKRLFTAGEQIAVGLREIKEKYPYRSEVPADLAPKVVAQYESGASVLKELHELAMKTLKIEAGDPTPDMSYDLRENWQIVSVRRNNGHDCGTCPEEKKATCAGMMLRAAPGARKSPVVMIQEALAIPEDQLDGGVEEPVAEDETVIGEASLVVKQLSTYRTKLVDEARSIEAKYPNFGSIPLDIMNDVLVQHKSAKDGAEMLERLVWSVIKTDTNEFEKLIGLRKDWQIVASEPEPDLGFEIIRIGSDGVASTVSIDELVARLFG